MAEIKYDVVRHIGIISETGTGWAKELNLVSWNDRPAKLDIRDWNEDRTRMKKGITLTKEEAEALKDLIAENIDSIE